MRTCCILLFVLAAVAGSQIVSCTIAAPTGGTAHCGVVTVVWDGVHSLGAGLTSRVEWSTDAGMTWHLATAAPGSPAANPDVGRHTPFSGTTFEWDARADGVGGVAGQQVDLRVTVDELGPLAPGTLVPHPTTPFFGSSQTLSLALGDLDGDQDLDLVEGTSRVEPELVWANDGHGNFSSHGTTPGPADRDARSVALGDLDGDLDLDLVIGNSFESSDGNTVWLNDGLGNYTPHPVLPRFGDPPSYQGVLGDLDGDLDLDLVVGRYFQLNTCWLNYGTGLYTPHVTVPTIDSLQTTCVGLGDLDGDQDLDLVCGESLGQPQSVWLNDGSGGFMAHPTTPLFGSGGTWALALGDLDGDLDLDLVLGNEHGQPNTVWLNDGLGSFTPHPSMPGLGLEDTMAIALGDLDGDLDLDLVVGNESPDPVSIWVNDGSGVFTPHPIVPTLPTGRTWALGLGDLDGDQDLDLVVGDVGDYAGVPNTVWLNQTVPGFLASDTVTPLIIDSRFAVCGDCAGDGNGFDILDALAAARIDAGLLVPSSCQAPYCDVDGSGAVTVVDALQLARRAVGIPTVIFCP